MADKEVTTAQAIEELAPLKRFGRALDKLDTVLQSCQGAESREKSANETVRKLETSIITLDSTVKKRVAQLEEMERTRVVRKGVIEVELKAYEDTETEQLNERLNGIRSDIAKAEQEFEKTQSSNFAILKRQGEAIEARNKRYEKLGRLIKKIQEPVQQIEVDKRI